MAKTARYSIHSVHSFHSKWNRNNAPTQWQRLCIKCDYCDAKYCLLPRVFMQSIESFGMASLKEWGYVYMNAAITIATVMRLQKNMKHASCADCVLWKQLHRATESAPVHRYCHCNADSINCYFDGPISYRPNNVSSLYAIWICLAHG